MADFEPLGEPGGNAYNEDQFKHEQIRADLCEIANLINYQYGTKIVEAILARYRVVQKTIKERSV